MQVELDTPDNSTIIISSFTIKVGFTLILLSTVEIMYQHWYESKFIKS